MSGSYGTTPLDGVTSLFPIVTAPIDESIVLDRKHVDEVSLDMDTAIPVSFGGGVINAHVVVLKAYGGPCVARVTSLAGTSQSIPFDTYLILMSIGTPVTAIDLIRTPATPTTVQVFLGQQA